MMLSSSECATSLLWRENICAANLPMLAGFTMKALEDPGGFVRQVLFMPSGGQETTGNLAKYEAVPDSASVPPAQPTIMTGREHLLYSVITDCKRAGCLCAEQILICASILNFSTSFFNVSRCGISESEPAAMITSGLAFAATVTEVVPSLFPVAGLPVSFASACSNLVIF